MTSDRGKVLSRAEIQQRASRGALWTGLHTVLSLPLNVLATLITARMLSVAGFGELAYLTVVLAVTQQITDFGYTSSAVQWGSQSRVEGDDRSLGRTLAGVTGFHVLVQGPVYVLVACVVLRDAGPGWAVAYAFASFLYLYMSGSSLALVLDQRNDVVAKIALVTNVITQTMVIGAAVLTHDPLAVLLCRAVAAILPGLVGLFVVRPELRRACLKIGKPWGTPAGFRRFALLSWGATSVALLVYSRSEIIILRLVSDAEQTALFALAFSVSQQLTGPVDALVAPLIPAMAGMATGHPKHLARAIARAVTLSSLLAGILLAGAVPALIAIFPLLYGDHFAGAAALFAALGLISTFQTATAVIGLLVQAQRKGGGLLRANLVALAINLMTAVPLIALWGAWGAMTANVLGQLTSIAMLTRSATSGNAAVPWRTIARSLTPWVSAVPGSLVGVGIVVLTQGTLGHLGAAVAAGSAGILAFAVTMRVGGTAPSPADVAALVGALPARLRNPARTALSLALGSAA